MRSLRNRYDGNNRPITEFSNEGIEATLVKTSESEFPMREGFLVYSMAEGQPPSLFAVYDSATPVSNIAEITSDGFFSQETLNPSGEASNLVWQFKRTSSGAMYWKCGTYSWNGTADKVEFEVVDGMGGGGYQLRAKAYVGTTVVSGSAFTIPIVSGATVKLPGDLTVGGFTGCSCNGKVPQTDGIADLDRTDTRLVKVVEVPYLPFPDDVKYFIDKEYIRILFSDVEPSLRTKVGQFDFDPAKYFKGE